MAATATAQHRLPPAHLQFKITPKFLITFPRHSQRQLGGKEFVDKLKSPDNIGYQVRTFSQPFRQRILFLLRFIFFFFILEFTCTARNGALFRKNAPCMYPGDQRTATFPGGVSYGPPISDSHFYYIIALLSANAPMLSPTRVFLATCPATLLIIPRSCATRHNWLTYIEVPFRRYLPG